MILRVLALVCLLQVALARSRTSCGEKEFYNRLIQVCEQCRTCEEGSYEERPCTPYRDTQCIECGVVDHENEDFKEKCGVQVDQDFKDAIEVQIRGQLEKTFAIKAVKPEDEMDSKVAKELKKINDEFYEPEIISNGKEDGDADETEEIDTDEDVAFVINNLEIDDSSEEPRPKIGDGAIPGFMEVEIIELPRHLQPRKRLAFANKRRFFENEEDDLKPVAIDETADDSSDYDDEDKPEKTIVKEEEDEDEDDELKLIELEENDRRLVSFEEADDEREPFPELLPQKTKNRPIPAIRLLDPLFDLDDEEEKLKKVDEDDLDEIKEMVIERIKPHFIDFKTWKQQRRGGVMSIQWEGDDNDSDSDSDSDESSEKDIASVRKEDPSFHRHIFRAMIFTSFFLLFVVLLFWIKQLRRRNRIYHHHISRLRYLTPEERQVIERAAGFLQKPPTNIYENHVYESA